MKTKLLVGIFALVLLVSLVSALEIKSGTSETLTIFLKNATTNAPATGANCTLSVWNTTNTKILTSGAMTEMGDGFYYYNTLTTNPWKAIGNFRVLARCIYGGKSYYSAMMYTVVPTTVTEWFTTINKTTVSTNKTVNKINLTANNIYSYLQNTINPAITNLQTGINQLKTNNTNIWNRLVAISANLTKVHAEIISVNTTVKGINTTTMAELVNQRNRIIAINTTVSSVLRNITLTVNPKLNSILADTAIIKGYTDTLETSMTSVLANLTQIKTTVNTISTKTDTVIGYVDEVEKGLKCTGGANVSAICNRIVQINTTINTINANTDSLEAGQTSIINYVDTLESGQATLTTKINEVKSYLNCSTALTNSVCWRLDLIQSYTDTLESGQTTIRGYVDSLEAGQASILANMTIIKGYTDTVETVLGQIQTQITNINATNKNRFNAIDANLSLIKTNINTILTSGVKLDANTNATLYNIRNKVNDVNTTVYYVKNYLNGKVTQLLTDINQTTSITVTPFGGTEYATGEIVKLSLQLLQGLSQNPITGATCTYFVYYPNNTQFRTGLMLHLINGIYYTNFTAPSKEGVYLASYNCTSGGVNRRSTDSFHVASWANKIGPMNQTLTNLQLGINQLKANNTNIWNRLVTISANLTKVHAEISSVNTTVKGINATTMAELVSQRNRLIAMNTTVSAIYRNITQTVVPKLNSVLSDTALIKGYTSGLAAGQTNILANLTLIQSYTDSVEGGIALIRSDITNINNTNKAKFSQVYSNLSKIYNDTQYIRTHIGSAGLTAEQNTTLYLILKLTNNTNRTTHQVQAYLNGTITTYLANINSTVTKSYNLLLAMNLTLKKVYNDTQIILSKWGSYNASQIMSKLNTIQYDVENLNLSGTNLSIDNTAVLSALNRLEGITNSTRAELGFKGKSLTAYDYFVKLENELLLINTTILNKVTFEGNLTRTQISNAISGNSTVILNKVNANTGNLTLLVSKWGNVTAKQILNNVTDNRNRLISLQAWLDAFNSTEFDRYNSTKTYMGGLFNWFTYMNQTEIQRHNLTQAKIDDVYSLLNLTYNNSIKVISQLGYSGKSTTVYSDLQKIISGNQNITIICRELNLTTIQINRTVSQINLTVNNIYSYLQNTINPAITNLQTGVNQLKANNTNIWNRLVAISSNLTKLDNAIVSVNTTVIKTNQTVMTELISQRNRLIAINTTVSAIYRNITQTVVPKLNSVLSDTALIKGYTSGLAAGQTNILANLTLIESYTDSVEGGIAQIRSDITNINNTNKAQFNQVYANLSKIYNDTQYIRSHLSGSGLTAAQNQTLYAILALTTETNKTTHDVQEYLNGTITAYLANINATVTSTYSLLLELNSTIGSIYTNTEKILAKWGTYNMSQIWTKLDAIQTDVNSLNLSGSNLTIDNTALLNAILKLEGITNSTRGELGFSGKSLTAYDYFVQLENELLLINTTILNKITFEGNLTRAQISNAIAGNSSVILNKVNGNSGNLTAILNKWGNVTAKQILNNVTDNRNKLIALQAWLDAFNSTEFDRYNSTYTYIGGLFNWFTILNQTEQNRHDLTQTKIDDVYDLLNLTYNNSINVLAVLGYSGSGTTLYNDVLKILGGNENITILCRQLNLTTIEINKTLTNVSYVVNSIYSYLQNTIYPAVDTLESSVAQLQANNTNIWNRLVGISTNLTNTYGAVLAVNTAVVESNQTIMNELASQRARLIAMNATVSAIYRNITQTVVPKLNTALSDLTLIKGYTDSLELGHSAILANLTLIEGYTDGVESGLNQVLSDIQNVNATSKARFDSIDSDLADLYSDTQSIITNGVKLDSKTNRTLYKILNLTTETNTTVRFVEAYLTGNITQFLIDINNTVKMSHNLLLAMNLTLASVKQDTQTVLAKWGSYNMSQIWGKLNAIETKIDNLNVSGSGGNNTQVLAAINKLESIVNATRDELNFTGKGITAFEYFVRLENAIYEVNQTLFNKIEFEGNLTRTQILSAIKANNTLLYNQLLSNANKLDNILLKWGNVSAEGILNNVTATRNKVIDIENWLLAFNQTEFNRYNSTYTYIGGLFNWFTLLNETEQARHDSTQQLINNAFVVINDTNDKIINLTAQIGYEGKATTLYDDIQTLITQTANITINIGSLNITVEPTDYVLLHTGKNLFALPKEPSNPAIQVVLAELGSSYYRVDYFNQTSQTFKTYIPSAPFGNTLTELHKNQVYWIWMYYDDVLFIT